MARFAPPITVKAVGFWRGGYGNDPRYPRPQHFVRRGWHAAELKLILAYLRSGYPAAAYQGSSTCRFRGCVEGKYNGSQEFTDTEWGWPQGLAHYVERHAVILPEKFVNTMRANNWQMPTLPKPLSNVHLDDTYWIKWATRSRPKR